MKAYYDERPQNIENIGRGKYYVNMDIVETEEGFECEQIKLFTTPTYPSVVEALIRERYTISDEIALLRQKDTKPEEFAEYNTYCEQCKAKARPLFNQGGE